MDSTGESAPQAKEKTAGFVRVKRVFERVAALDLFLAPTSASVTCPRQLGQPGNKYRSVGGAEMFVKFSSRVMIAATCLMLASPAEAMPREVVFSQVDRDESKTLDMKELSRVLGTKYSFHYMKTCDLNRNRTVSLREARCRLMPHGANNGSEDEDSFIVASRAEVRRWLSQESRRERANDKKSAMRSAAKKAAAEKAVAKKAAAKKAAAEKAAARKAAAEKAAARKAAAEKAAVEKAAAEKAAKKAAAEKAAAQQAAAEIAPAEKAVKKSGLTYKGVRLESR